MPQATAAPLEQLARLVVKDGVSLGLLPEPERQLALAWVWAGLPAAAAMNEAGINEALKAQLGGPVVCLNTDHVELRRWLVDAGWLQRDGYGREYRRAAAPAAHAALAEALQGLDTTAWTAQRRRAHEAERDARRQRWAQQQAQHEPGIRTA
jgi:Uncharacterized protein conserved in bacteria (DUF2087)